MDMEDLVTLLRERSEVIPVNGNLRLCRDPDDDVVLETAFLGQANAMVSRDEDIKGDIELVSLLRTAGIEVLSVGRFLATLQAEGAP
jgi:predicted nucleic acid-binding protein